MASKTHFISKAVRQYVAAHSAHPDALLEELRAVTDREPMGRMQIGSEQGAFLTLLVELAGARRAIEIGTFTGYSAICIARALRPGGSLITCDVSERWTVTAREFWRRAGLEDRIALRLAPALDTLDGLLRDRAAGSFDFAFIDADKENYDGYYEHCLALIRPGGLIVIDNVLWSGAVAGTKDQAPSTVALRKLNDKLVADARIDVVMLPIGDGMTLALKN
jgi:predicted O-methyltransferase YrrM